MVIKYQKLCGKVAGDFFLFNSKQQAPTLPHPHPIQNTIGLPCYVPNHKSQYAIQASAQQNSMNDTTAACLQVAIKRVESFLRI